MTDFRARLAYRFRKQQEFAAGYSPLYARLFGILGDWIAAGDGDPLVGWLVEVSNGRGTLDVTLLILAGLHRDILNHLPETAELAQYYPTVGGTRSPDEAQLPQILRRTIIARRDQLAPFIQTAAVQTNETGRGACWLLPLLYTGWEAVHLVDLGASAGLNLVAEKRNYRLHYDNQSTDTGDQVVDIGSGSPVQFQMQCQGEFELPPYRLPRIATRTGCDLAPFKLESADDEQTLAAFIWADQPHRLERLREGITAYHHVNLEHPTVHLHLTNLPNELPQFLNVHVPQQANQPVVIYNTIITFYLIDHGRSLRHHIANWAAMQNRPILWLQWEPLWEGPEGPEAPEYGWIAWTADLWQAKSYHRWHLAWNHPHGTEVQWQSDFNHWVEFWR
jgi:hypothetical protein